MDRQKTSEDILNRKSERPGGAIFRFNASPTLSILNGNRFMTTARDGNINDEEHGIFRDDTRFLSLYEAKINGSKLTSLTSNNTTHYSAIFYLTNPTFSSKEEDFTRKRGPTREITKESLAVRRSRFIEHDLYEDFAITNVTSENLEFSLSFNLATDFADIFEVKSNVFGKKPDMIQDEAQTEGSGNQQRRRQRIREITTHFSQKDNTLIYSWTDPKTNFKTKTMLRFSQSGVFWRGTNDLDSHDRIAFSISLKPKDTFQTRVSITMLIGDEGERPNYTKNSFEKQEQMIRGTIANWNLHIPHLETSWDNLKHSYYQSMLDLLFLRMSDPTQKHGWTLLAAGCPWFMTLFGRDTIITSYQSLLFGGDLAKGAIAALSQFQGTKVDDNKDEQPGKVIHELRYGDYAARSNKYPYYGTADATPLFLILFSEVYRWTKDADFAQKYKQNAINALNWVENYGDIDQDGFQDYSKQSETGLQNQSWKDSWNSIQFADGRIAKPPIATCEIQGYVYDAKMRIAEIAKDVWKDNSLAKKLIDGANELKELFNEKFWIEDKGYYALALDKNKNQVDSLTSNNGQLLWSGIVSNGHVKSVVEKLMDNESLYSGYGIRTLSASAQGYDPIGYHTGCVWAHDNSLIASGLARYGSYAEAYKIATGILDASPHFGYTLPEAFAGFSRKETQFPVRYPTACSPQAWAAATPLLLLRTLLGISPSQNRKSIEVDSSFDHYKEGKTNGFDISLRGVSAFNKKFDIEIKDGSKPQIHEEEDDDEQGSK